MKFVLSCLLLFLAAVAQALSATGDRLLSIWEDVADQKLYSKFLGDLESMALLKKTCCSLSIADLIVVQLEASRSLMPPQNRRT